MINKSIEGRFSENPEGLSTHQRQRLGEISQYMDPQDLARLNEYIKQGVNPFSRDFYVSDPALGQAFSNALLEDIRLSSTQSGEPKKGKSHKIPTRFSHPNLLKTPSDNRVALAISALEDPQFSSQMQMRLQKAVPEFSNQEVQPLDRLPKDMRRQLIKFTGNYMPTERNPHVERIEVESVSQRVSNSILAHQNSIHSALREVMLGKADESDFPTYSPEGKTLRAIGSIINTPLPDTTPLGQKVIAKLKLLL